MNLKVGVIGHPIKHSLSPYIHTYWIEKHGIRATYKTFDILSENLEDFLYEAKNTLLGFNITTPYKEKVIGYCTQISPLAKAVGAVNTVVVKEGKFYGYNTDVYGVRVALENSLKHRNIQMCKKHAVLLGAGGASRAVVCALKQMAFDSVTIINRTYEKAKNLETFFSSVDMPIKAVSLQEAVQTFQNATLLINASLAGMNGKNILPLPLQALPKTTVVYDIVYEPLMTSLLQDSKKLGLPIVQGIDMLLYQAVGGFEQWFSIKPAVDDALRTMILAKCEKGKK